MDAGDPSAYRCRKPLDASPAFDRQPPARQPRPSPSEVEAIRGMLLAEWPLEDLVAHFARRGLSRAQVLSALDLRRQVKMSTLPKRIGTLRKGLVLRLDAQGLRRRAIAATLGVPRCEVDAALRKKEKRT